MWYVIIEGATLGPFTEDELFRQPGFTPDSLVWRDGFAGWTPARDVEELKDLFKDKNSPQQEEEDEDDKSKLTGDDVLAAKAEPPFLLIWFIIAALILIYLLTQLYVGN